ncbi:hypothetical protein PgNI_10966 [Pyricularia grisea]|uniref:Uncharacterized protein n=1 Tax=Pyricularia grisea TaxID=148305 RepID=A0A6P8AZC5_PYRGI|nr:hypothetical protein PgNI_10966 [Pyricularia grisea]TLD07644.1 hypothetical protein PgNI_10966 [Pyricularia grisea]
MSTPNPPSKTTCTIPSRPERVETQDGIPSSVGAESGPGTAPEIKVPQARATVVPRLNMTSEPCHVSTANGNVSVGKPNRGCSESRGDGAQTGPTGYIYFPRFVPNYNFWASQYIERV